MSAWEDFLDDIFGNPNQPGKVMICFVNRYLEGMDDVKYKIKYDGHEKSGVTTTQNYCIELSPTSFKPLQIFVWSRQAKAWKKLDDVIAEPGHKKLVRKMLKTFKLPGKTGPLPDTLPNKRPDQPAPATAPGPSPTDPQGITPDQTQNENDQPQAKPRRPVPGEITKEQLRKIFPKNKGGNPTDDHLQDVANELNKDLAKYKLDTSVRRAHFFGQVKQEAGPLLSGAPESFNYKASVLLAKFGYYKRHHDEAKTDGRAENSKVVLTTEQQQMIANKVYGGQHGFDDLGNLLKQPNDGWNFRGRGMKQTTGRDNYQKFTDKHKELWGEDIDFIAHPDKVSEMPYAVRSAVVFWVYKHCWQAADGGINDSAIDAVTHIVNSGELAAYNKHPTTDSPVLNRRKFAKLAYAAFS